MLREILVDLHITRHPPSTKQAHFYIVLWLTLAQPLVLHLLQPIYSSRNAQAAL